MRDAGRPAKNEVWIKIERVVSVQPDYFTIARLLINRKL